jgi:DNA polymerase-3 subunit gamma/tau
LPDELNVSKALPNSPVETKPEIPAAYANIQNVVDIKRAITKPELVKAQVTKPLKDEKWLDIIPQLALTGQSAELIKHSLLASKEGGMISLTLEVSNQGLIADAIKDEMQTALNQYYGESLTLSFTVAKIETKENSGTINETHSKRSEREQIEAQQQAEQNIESDPFVIELKNRFGAQVVPGSVYPK